MSSRLTECASSSPALVACTRDQHLGMPSHPGIGGRDRITQPPVNHASEGPTTALAAAGRQALCLGRTPGGLPRPSGMMVEVWPVRETTRRLTPAPGAGTLGKSIPPTTPVLS